MHANADTSDARLAARVASLTDAQYAAENAILAEHDVFVHRGTLFYRHESGVIFSASIYELANTPATRAPPRRRVAAVPELATPYELPEGSARETRTDAWTNACDSLYRSAALS